MTTHRDLSAEPLRPGTRPPAAPPPAVSEHDHVLGDVDARVTLVEYGDFRCPHSARAYPVVSSVRESLGPKLRFVFRNFPLTSIHREPLHLAEAAESVSTHAGPAAYWKMYDALFELRSDPDAAPLDDASLVRLAADAGADADVVRAELASGAQEERVRTDFMSGVHSGVTGTPTFFVNDVRFEGDWSNPAAFTAALEAAAGGEVHER